jgi:hypothetical protein
MKTRLLFALFLLGLAVSCRKSDPATPLPDGTDCFDAKPVVRRADNLDGYVDYRQDLGMYIITYTVPKTIDSQWNGFVCNLPTVFQVVGKKVTFSGEYRNTDGKILPRLGGEETFYLKLSAIK